MKRQPLNQANNFTHFSPYCKNLVHNKGLFQGWEFTHLLIAHSLICSFAQNSSFQWATVSDLLRLLRTNVPLWANRSGRSWQKSDREWITQVAWQKSDRERFSQVAHEKRANERMSELLFFWANPSFALSLTKNDQLAQKNLNKIVFLYVFCKLKKWGICSFPLFKRAMWANCSGRSWQESGSLTKNEQMSESLIFLVNCSFANFFANKKKRFA